MTTETQKIPTGCKQTEIGVIPVDWKIVRAGDIGRFRGGNGFPTRLQGATSGEYPFYKVSDMNNAGNDTFMFDSNNWISDGVKRQLNATIFPAGSIIFAKVGAAVFLERKKILTRPSCIDNNLAALVLDSARTDVRFIHYVLHSIKFGALVSTTALPSLSGSVLSQIALPLPLLDEQVAIAAALSDADALIAKLETLLEKKKLIKQGAMQELLTGKRRLPGFSGEWEIKTLGDVCDIEKGSQVNKSKLTEVGKYPAWNGGIMPSGYTDNWNTEKDTITISEGGNSCGFVNYCNQKFWCGGHCYAIKRIVDGVDKNFLYQKLKYLQENIMGLRVGSGLPNIQKKNLLNLDLDLPKDEKEQIAITSILSDMDAKIENLESQLTKYQHIKQGMMQVLLTGKIRLI